MNRRRPDLFIVGAPKCGTTSLYEYLRQHPEVFMSPTKEPRYFSPDVQAGVTRDGLRHGQDLERYLDLFAAARGEKRLGEATTRYLYSRQAPGLIREFEPGAFIVAVLRNPVQMMHSLHAHHLASGAEDIADFAKALEAEGDRRRGLRVPPRSFGSLLLYRDWARFGEQLSRWHETFGPERVHVMLFEELTRDPAATYRGLLEFLEVDVTHQPDSFGAHNVANVPRSATLRALLNSRGPRRILTSLLPEDVRLKTTRRLGASLRRLNRQAIKRAPLDPGLRLQLEAELAPDVALASRLIGRDLASAWFQTEATASATERVPSGAQH